MVYEDGITSEQDLIEKILSQEDAERRINSLGPTDEEARRVRERAIALINNFLTRLPVEEHDFLILYYMEDVPQRSIGNLFGITQRAISYRIARAVGRLKFLVDIAEVDIDEMRGDLLTVFPKEQETIDIVCKVFAVTNLSEVQRKENLSFFHVRSRYYYMLETLQAMNLEKLEETNPDLCDRLKTYIRCLELVRDNFGILSSQRKARCAWNELYLG